MISDRDARSPGGRRRTPGGRPPASSRSTGRRRRAGAGGLPLLRPLRLGDVELVLGALEGVQTVADPVGPRREDVARGARRDLIGPEAVEHLDAAAESRLTQYYGGGAASTGGRHAAETGTPIPKNPTLFNKFNNALNHHGGTIAGGRAMVMAYPDSQVVVVMLANVLARFGEPEAQALVSLRQFRPRRARDQLRHRHRQRAQRPLDRGVVSGGTGGLRARLTAGSERTDGYSAIDPVTLPSAISFWPATSYAKCDRCSATRSSRALAPGCPAASSAANAEAS